MSWLFLFEALIAFSISRAAVGDFTTRVVKADLFAIENPKELLYTFERSPIPEGSTVKAVRTYKDTKGSVVAAEELVYENGKVKKMTVDLKQVSESGSFELKDGKIFFSYTKDGKTETDDEKVDDVLLVADSMAAFIHDNWPTLAKGETIKFRLPVPARLETVGFKFQKEGEATFEGKPVDLVKMSPSSAIISMLVKPIYFSVDRGPDRQVVQVVGRTLPKIQKNGKWTDLDAISVFKHPKLEAAKASAESAKPLKK